MRHGIAPAFVFRFICVLFAVFVPSLALADDVLRFKCTLIDGSVHLFIEDMSVRQPGLTTACERVQLPAASRAMSDTAAGAGLAERLATLVTVIDGGGATTATQRTAMPFELTTLVNAASTRYRLDAALIGALIFVESRYRPDARSPKGALGLMQLMPDTAARYGVKSERELLDPSTNVDVGVRHLRSLRELYGGRVDLMLAAYNAGEAAVRRHGNRVPPYPETEAYVQQIMAMSRGREYR